jgi:hypothetical protein
MKTNRLLLAVALVAISLTSCVKDELYEDPTVIVESSIVMNEIFSRGTAENLDWIEVYNNSNEAFDISGYKIYDGGGESGSKPKKVFPAGAIIPAKGFYVIVTDDNDPSGFGLSSGGESVWLENSAGDVIDYVDFPAMDNGTTYGRIPDGSETWEILEVPTPGEPNSDASAPTIFMNEIYSRGTAENPDWIEVYNTSDQSVDISGYLIYDSGGQAGSKPKKAFPSGSVVPANGFLVIVTDDEDESGFGLSSSGEEVWLEDASGTIIDNVTFPALEETQSYGRFPDGSSNWQVLETVTPGEPNSNTSPLNYELIHYWHFNSLPEGTLTDPVISDFTATNVGEANITYPGTGDGYMDRVDPGSEINSRMDEVVGFGLRPRNPANTRELIIVSPSTGYSDLLVSFAVMRSGNGAVQEEFYYSVNGGTDWVKFGDTYNITESWALVSFNLSEVTDINNNDNLQFRILFVGTNSDGTSGNNRFDNITIEGVKTN